jgi:8-oxo-dGTP diphosphatase
MTELVFVTAAALITHDGQILLQKRPEGGSMAGLWEFPGGKVEAGETPEAALVRELAEELGITLAEEGLKPLTFASAPLGNRRLLLLLYVCRQWQGEPKPLHATQLQWVKPEAMAALPMPPADVPLVDSLIAYCASGAQPVR